MNTELSSFAARLLPLMRDSARQAQDNEFNELALQLFGLQFKHNAAYRKICEARGRTPEVVEHWTQIPAVPTAAFKELELTSLPPDERTAVFHSSGTTEQKPSRHFHNAESLAIYEESLWKWFERHAVLPGPGSGVRGLGLCILTPPPAQAPHSSLVHMFEVVRRKLGGAGVLASGNGFFGKLSSNGAWTLDFDAAIGALAPGPRTPDPGPLLVLGTAFSFVHLLDYLVANNLHFRLPKGSRVMETGGYKNRSRHLPKAELHPLITERLGIPPAQIICEYGMSELSSQAYDGVRPSPGAATLLLQAASDFQESPGVSPLLRPGRAHSGFGIFHFPTWARVQIISPETSCEVRDGETGLIRVFDLANVFSVAAIQTEDLGVRRGGGFELVGRAELAAPRGCSLMAHSAIA